MKTDLFQSCGHCWIFQICWHVDCSTFTATSFRIWNSSTGIPSLPLALFVVMLSKAHLTSHSRVSGSRWVITPSWLSGSLSCVQLWPDGLYSPWILQVRILEWVVFHFSQGSSQSSGQTQVSHIAGGLPAESQGKPKNTEVGSLSLLQWISKSQESNRGLLHCTWIVYQLSYQGSHKEPKAKFNKFDLLKVDH